MRMTGPRRRRRASGRAHGMLLLAAIALGAGLGGGAQQRYLTGQAVMPAYEGWERNADGSFDLVFGTMNRNWQQEIDIPSARRTTSSRAGPTRVSRRTSCRGATGSCSACGCRRTSATTRWCGR